MPHFGESIKEVSSSDVGNARISDAPYANPDKLVLPDSASATHDISSARDLVDSIRTRMENERIARYRDAYCPRAERFEGDRGDSLALPDESLKSGASAKQWLSEHGLRGIEYRYGYPDFSPVALESVTIPRMTADRPDNFRQAYKAVAEKWNAEGREGRTDWKPSDVKAWKTENGLAVHEKEDLKTCEFVPICVHDHYSHIGGKYISAVRGIFSERQQEMMSQQRGDFNDQFDA